MSSTLLPVGPPLAFAIGGLALVAVAVSVAGRLGHGRAVVTAVARAVLQLAAVSLLLAAIVRVWSLTVVFVAVMLVVASGTAARRITRHRSGWWAALPIAVGVLPIVLTLLATRVLPNEPLAVIPVTGILVGGAMTACALAGRRAADDLRHRRGEVEAGLSLGLTPRDAALEVVAPTAPAALIPVLDQTRTVGLVTLPGAFVGMLLGGADPLHAGAVQLFVLVALIAVESIAAVLTIELIARGMVVGRVGRSATGQTSW